MNLIPMKDSDYAAYLTNAVFEYANDKVQAGTWAKDEALALAKESFASLLPQGTATENNHLFSLFAADFSEPIGVIWVNTAAQKAFIYDFIIEEDQRGKGYGTKALQTLEKWAIQQGITEIGLHVFAHNQSAYQLYKKMGYLETDITMVRRFAE